MKIGFRNWLANLFGGRVSIDFPDVEFNPWHPAYRLSPEGREKTKRELAAKFIADLKPRLTRAKSVTVAFGGVPYAGWVKK
jgi:hypothetical protein